MKKIAFILYTNGIENDDRVRKEAMTLSKYGNVTIFALTPENTKTVAKTTYGIPFIRFKLISRSILPSGRFAILKSIEFYLRVRKNLKSFDVIWTHDVEPFLVPLSVKNKHLVWDLHEIPAPFLKNSLTNKLFRKIESRCNTIIHANPHRFNYLVENKLIKRPNKHQFIRNYPDRLFIKTEKVDPKFSDFTNWLNGSEYVFLQGLYQGRYPENTLDAIMQTKNLKAVVLGNFSDKLKGLMIQRYGEQFAEKIYVRGKVDVLFVAKYIQSALFSMVFYNDHTPNNRFCEPNRMYQAIASGIPVLVGYNEPMKDIVEKFGFGYVLNNDGRDLDSILVAIVKIRKSISLYHENIQKNKFRIMWDNQNDIFDQIMKLQ